MFSSIFGLLQISTSIVNQQRYFNPTDVNDSLNHKLLDKQFLNMLRGNEINSISSSLGIWNQLCTNLKTNTVSIDPSNPPPPLESFFPLLNDYEIDSNFIVDNNGIINDKVFYKFLSGCAFNRQGNIKHRVIINPPDPILNENKFTLYSCILDSEQVDNNRCIFEEVD